MQRKKYALASIFYILLSLQTIEVYAIGGVNVKLYHILTIGTLVVCCAAFRYKRNLAPLYIYLGFCIVLSTLVYVYADVNSLYINYLFCLAVLALVSSIFLNLNYDLILNALRLATWSILIISLINIGNNFHGIQYVYGVGNIEGARPQLPWLVYGGGVNLEASWIALGAAFHIRRRFSFLIYLIGALVVSGAMLSRAGFIVIFVVGLCKLYIVLYEIYPRKLVILFSLTSVFLIGVTISYWFKELPIFARFWSIGYEPGSMSRLEMWSHIPALMRDGFLIGVGAGNSIKAVNENGYMGTEDNVHNYVFHNLLEFGPIGLLLWGGMIYYLIFRSRKFELSTYVFAFVVIAMVQFRGAEPLFYYVSSLLLVSRLTSRERKE